MQTNEQTIFLAKNKNHPNFFAFTSQTVKSERKGASFACINTGCKAVAAERKINLRRN